MLPGRERSGASVSASGRPLCKWRSTSTGPGKPSDGPGATTTSPGQVATTPPAARPRLAPRPPPPRPPRPPDVQGNRCGRSDSHRPARTGTARLNDHVDRHRGELRGRLGRAPRGGYLRAAAAYVTRAGGPASGETSRAAAGASQAAATTSTPPRRPVSPAAGARGRPSGPARQPPSPAQWAKKGAAHLRGAGRGQQLSGALDSSLPATGSDWVRRRALPSCSNRPDPLGLSHRFGGRPLARASWRAMPSKRRGAFRSPPDQRPHLIAARAGRPAGLSRRARNHSAP